MQNLSVRNMLTLSWNQVLYKMFLRLISLKSFKISLIAVFPFGMIQIYKFQGRSILFSLKFLPTPTQTNTSRSQLNIPSTYLQHNLPFLTIPIRPIYCSITTNTAILLSSIQHHQTLPSFFYNLHQQLTLYIKIIIKIAKQDSNRISYDSFQLSSRRTNSSMAENGWKERRCIRSLGKAKKASKNGYLGWFVPKSVENDQLQGERKRLLVLNIRYSFNSSMEGKKEKVSTEQIIESVVDKVFKKYDLNQNNFIDFPEFCKMIQDLKLSVSISTRDISTIFEMLDEDCDGKVSRHQLIEAFLAVKSPVN